MAAGLAVADAGKYSINFARGARRAGSAEFAFFKLCGSGVWGGAASYCRTFSSLSLATRSGLRIQEKAAEFEKRKLCATRSPRAARKVD